MIAYYLLLPPDLLTAAKEIIVDEESVKRSYMKGRRSPPVYRSFLSSRVNQSSLYQHMPRLERRRWAVMKGRDNPVILWPLNRLDNTIFPLVLMVQALTVINGIFSYASLFLFTFWFLLLSLLLMKRKRREKVKESESLPERTSGHAISLSLSVPLFLMTWNRQITENRLPAGGILFLPLFPIFHQWFVGERWEREREGRTHGTGNERHQTRNRS